MSDQLKATSNTPCYTPAYPTSNAPACDESSPKKLTCNTPNQSLPESKDTFDDQANASNQLNKKLNLPARKPERQPKNQSLDRPTMTVREMQMEQQASIAETKVNKILGNTIKNATIGSEDYASEGGMNHYFKDQLFIKGGKPNAKQCAYLINHPVQFEAKVREQLREAGVPEKSMNKATKLFMKRFERVLANQTEMAIYTKVQAKLTSAQNTLKPLATDAKARTTFLLALADSGKSANDVAAALERCGIPKEKAKSMAARLVNMKTQDPIAYGKFKSGQRGIYTDMDKQLKQGARKMSKALGQLAQKPSNDLSSGHKLLTNDLYSKVRTQLFKEMSIDPKAKTGAGRVIGDAIGDQKSREFADAVVTGAINSVNGGISAMVIYAVVDHINDTDKVASTKLAHKAGLAEDNAIRNAQEDEKLNKVLAFVGFGTKAIGSMRAARTGGRTVMQQTVKEMGEQTIDKAKLLDVGRELRNAGGQSAGIEVFKDASR